MKIQHYTPGKPVNLFIEKIMQINIDMKTLISNQNLFIPNGKIVLVIHLQNTMALQNECALQVLPKMFFVGLLSYSRNLKPLGDLISIFVIFKPNALHNLYKIDMKDLKKSEYINAFDVLGNDSVSLYDQLLSVNNINEQFHITENYFESYLNHQQIKPDIIDNILEIINKEKGCVRVNEITEYFNIAERTLYHKFLTQTGLSPKEYIRLIRFGNIMRNLKNISHVNMFDIFNNSDLYDQSHLIKEIKNFTGYTPKSILNLDLNYYNTLNATIE